jgi:hypothetical protein
MDEQYKQMAKHKGKDLHTSNNQIDSNNADAKAPKIA